MSESKYKVEEVYLNSVSFRLLIYLIPESDVNDQLTYFTRDRGLVSCDLYNDFLIATCIPNINDFLQHLKKIDVDAEKLSEVRSEIVEKVLLHNPLFDPNNIVINSINVLKVKGDEINKGEILLTNNKHWAKELYSTPSSKNTETSDSLDVSNIKNVRDLPHTMVQKFWKRLNTYIKIKQFEPGAELIILNDRSFNSRMSFEQYVITVCIDDIEELFYTLDKMGIPDRVLAPILIHELYELCRKSNPFLDFDIYKETITPEEIDTSIDPFETVQNDYEQVDVSKNTLADALKHKKRNTFRDVSKEKLLNLESNIKKKVIGQDESINQLVDSIQRASVGLKNPEQPIGSFVFTGYTGIGKTYTAKILAEELTGSRQNLVSIDCSEYSADHEYAKLIGAPSGYIGHDQGGYLTNAVKKNPFSVILFDEVEKASEKVHQLLLQIMDEARLTDGRGNKVSFKDTVIVMTSNLGVQETQHVEKLIGFGNASVLTKEKRMNAVKNALKKKFKPEFLNRITCMINFDPLASEDYIKIIELELNKLNKYLKLNKTSYSKLSLEFDESLYEYIYKLGIDDKFGARPLQRSIEREISTPLARKLLKENIECDNTKILISAKDGEIVMDVKRNRDIDNPPFYMTALDNNE